MSSKINLGLPKFILKMGNPTTRYVYEFGDFRLDACHRMLYHGDEELSLAPKAVETLVALVERRGEIMSKDELLEAVWPDAVVEESNLFVYLSVLRKTLGTQESGDPWVETLRRRGYRFSGDVRLVPEQNGGNGIPVIRTAALRLVHATSDVPGTSPGNGPPEPSPRKWARLRTVYAVAGLALVVVSSVVFTYQYFVNRPIDSIAIEQGVSSNYPTNTDAYRLYQIGLGYTLKLTPSEIRTGIDYLYEAVAKDPAYAKAYVSIARAHLILGIAGEVHPVEFIKARDAAKKAIELDGTLAEGYSALAGVAFFYDRNFAEAESLYKRAVELDPKSSTAHQQYADFLNKIGRHEEGGAAIARAMELEPSSAFINAFYAVSLRDNKAALEQIRFAIDQSPNNYVVRLFAGEICRRNELYDEAVAELRRAKELSPQQTWSDVALIGALVHVGKNGEARMILERMLSDSKTRYIPSPHLALAYKQLGDREKASIYFEEGYSVRDPKMVFLNEPRWNDRDDPQFQELLRRVGF